MSNEAAKSADRGRFPSFGVASKVPSCVIFQSHARRITRITTHDPFAFRSNARAISRPKQ